MSGRTHYEVLGVEPGADRDSIRDAYRSRIAELKPDVYRGSTEERVDESMRVNKAWNVLSDPFQRGRYDDELGAGEGGELGELPLPPLPDGDADGNGTGAAGRGARAPSGLQGLFAGRRATATPRGGSGTGAAGAGKAGGGKAGGGKAGAGKAPVEYPGGLVPAPTKSRINALSIDLAVLILIVIGLQFVSHAVAEKVLVVYRDGKPAKTVELKDRDPSALERQLKAEEDRRIADLRREAESKGDKPPDTPEIEIKHEELAVGGEAVALTLASVILPLAYLVPLSAATGQTLGKKRARIMLVRTDGSPAGWTASLVHYGVPIVVGLLLMPIGYLIGIGLVLWWLGDPRRQGVHDKLARTLVVEADVASGGRAGARA